MLKIDLTRYYQLIVENINETIWVLRPETNTFTFANEAILSLLGYPPTEFLSKTLKEVLHPDSYVKVTRSLKKRISLFESGSQFLHVQPLELTYVCKNGKTLTKEVVITLVPNEYRKIVEVIGVSTEITPRKMVTDSLIKTYHALTYIIKETSRKNGLDYFNAMVLALCETLQADYAHIGILQEDKEHIKTLALAQKGSILPNIEYKLSGTPCENVVNKFTSAYQKNVTTLFPGEILLQQMQVEGYIGVPLYFKNGNPMGLMVCLYKKPIKNSLLSETIIKIFSDRAVSEYEQLKNLEQLVFARVRAEESDRLKTMFLQNMSHEIRTPMNAIIGFSELLNHNFHNKEKLLQFSQIIQQRSKDLLELINDILDLSRIESGQQTIHFEPCNLNLLFDELSDMFQIYQTKKGKNEIRLRFYPICDPKQAVIMTDKDKLRRIFINLISNAIKFTERGKIEIGCSFSGKNEMKFYVSDTGKGIPMEKQKIIFERFTQLTNTTDHPVGGTGLGLPIVKGLVELLGGEIDVKSVEGEGSRFTFSFTYQQTQEKEIFPIVTEAIEYKQLPAKKLLLVEDDTYSAQFIMEILSDSGLFIHHVIGGKEAIEYLQKEQADMVLLDIRLPEMDGYEVARRVKHEWPNIKIIAQTAYAMQEDRTKAILSGCD